MPTVLHIASVFPSNSNRLALQFRYARDDWRIELLHLAAFREEIAAAGQGHEKIHVLPHAPRQREGEYYLVRRPRSLIRRIINTAALYMILIRSDADIMHAHENSSLWPLAFWVIILRRPAIWDPHDYFHVPMENQGSSLRLARLKALERAVVRHGTTILSVSDGMKEKYASLYPDTTNLVIRNYSSHRSADTDNQESIDSIAMRLVAQRKLLGEGTLRLVYPGLIKAERFTLGLIKKLGSINGISLDIYGEDRSGHARHQSDLEKTLTENRIENIHLRGAYTSDGIVPILTRYHLAILPYELSHPNIDFCLPNKFFQCIEAGLPLITTNMKEMGGLIEQHGLGYVFPSGDNSACAEILESCVVDDDEYLDLVRHVLIFQAEQVDYGQQQTMLLGAYAAAAT